MDYEKLKFLSVEEVDKLYYSITDEDEKKQVLFFCSDELKLKEVGLFKLHDRSIFSFVMSFKEQEKGKIAFYNYIKTSNANVHNLLTMLDIFCDVSYRGVGWG